MAVAIHLILLLFLSSGGQRTQAKNFSFVFYDECKDRATANRTIKVAVGDEYDITLLKEGDKIRSNFDCLIKFVLDDSTPHSTEPRYENQTESILKYTLLEWLGIICDTILTVSTPLETVKVNCTLQSDFRKSVDSQTSISLRFKIYFNFTHYPETFVNRAVRMHIVAENVLPPRASKKIHISVVIVMAVVFLIFVICCSVCQQMNNPTEALMGYAGQRNGIAGNNALVGLGGGALLGGALMSGGRGNANNILTGNTGIQQPPYQFQHLPGPITPGYNQLPPPGMAAGQPPPGWDPSQQPPPGMAPGQPPPGWDPSQQPPPGMAPGQPPPGWDPSQQAPPGMAPGQPPPGWDPSQQPPPGMAPGQPPPYGWGPSQPPSPAMAPGQLPPGWDPSQKPSTEMAPGQPHPPGMALGQPPPSEWSPSQHPLSGLTSAQPPPYGWGSSQPPPPGRAPGQPPPPGMAPGQPPPPVMAPGQPPPYGWDPSLPSPPGQPSSGLGAG